MPWMRHRGERQRKYLGQTDPTFGAGVLGSIPEFERDITGLPMIERMAEAMFGNGGK